MNKPILRSKTNNPFVPPPHQDVFDFRNLSERNLWQAIKSGDEPDFSAGQLRRGLRPDAAQKPRLPKQIHDDGKIRKRGLLQTTARDYMWAIQDAAKTKQLSDIVKDKTKRFESKMGKEREEIGKYRQQLDLHNLAFQDFLYEHHSTVAASIEKHEQTTQSLQDQEERLEYFSGLLKAAHTVQEEDKERLQELSAFQNFLAAITPHQSLLDLRRGLRRQEKQGGLKSLKGLGRKSLQQSESQVGSQYQEPVSNVGAGYLQSEVNVIRTLNVQPLNLVTSEDDSDDYADENTDEEPKDGDIRPSISITVTCEESEGKKPHLEEGSSTESEKGEFDSNLFDAFLKDPSYLLKLSHIYENQCHTLLSSLTRVKQKTEILDGELKNRQEKLNQRLRELDRLQEAQRHAQELQEQRGQLKEPGGGGKSRHLTEAEHLLKHWSHLAGDNEAKEEIAQLGKEISKVIRDAFGTSDNILWGGLSQTKKSGSSLESGSLGQAALLNLMEARVTDLFTQLDFIPKEMRDHIFKRCEQERLVLSDQALRQEEERSREVRRQMHLRRAMESPPPRSSLH